ncbi:MAG: hypothetical protein LBV38_05295 [Alistipes sp.]|nr:hypothetical protein [Alistipes sp.]
MNKGQWIIGCKLARKILRVAYVVLSFSIFNFRFAFLRRASAIRASTIALGLLSVQFSIITGCTKFTPDCELVVLPRLMTSAGSDIQNPAYMTRLYGWYIDEKDIMNWRPDTFADADAGIIRHRVTHEVRSHGITASQLGEDIFISMIITRSPVLLVAVDPVSGMYAWRTFKYQIPLQTTRVPVSFKTYLDTYPYKENEWTIDKLETPETEIPEDVE